MALAVLATGGLFFVVPEEFRLTNWWHTFYLVFLVVLLAILVLGDPGRIDRESRVMRVVTGIMLGLITIVTAFSALRLVYGLLTGSDFSTPGQLLAIGVVIWATNVISFALWYWHLDSGGPAARAHGTLTAKPAFRFPEQNLPEVVGAGWYPQFIDYLALSFNTATAFSPTDVAAIRRWPKLWMMFESSISLMLIALVLARAVNVL